MSFQSNIIEKVQLNPAHAKRCEGCFDTTSSLNFWIWDPSDDPEIPYPSDDAPNSNCAQILFTPTSRQRQESLEVNCLTDKERTLVALDKCLIADGSKCDGLIFEGTVKPTLMTWIELKMNMNRKNPKPTTLEHRIIGGQNGDKNAFDQIRTAKQFFIEKNITLPDCPNRWHVAIPKELKLLANKSNAIKKRIREILKIEEKLKITIDPVLELD